MTRGGTHGGAHRSVSTNTGTILPQTFDTEVLEQEHVGSSLTREENLDLHNAIITGKFYTLIQTELLLINDLRKTEDDIQNRPIYASPEHINVCPGMPDLWDALHRTLRHEMGIERFATNSYVGIAGYRSTVHSLQYLVCFHSVINFFPDWFFY